MLLKCASVGAVCNRAFYRLGFEASRIEAKGAAIDLTITHT